MGKIDKFSDIVGCEIGFTQKIPSMIVSYSHFVLFPFQNKFYESLIPSIK